MAIANGMLRTPPVVKNLLIINCLVFLAEYMLPVNASNVLFTYGPLYFWAGGNFHIWQPLTYMFMHAGFAHLFSNMFALWMFGRSLEYEMGSRRFLIYYMACGIGAALIQLGVNWIEYAAAAGDPSVAPSLVYRYANASTIGASGAVFGLLLAFGVMHPNNVIMLLFPPIALKAKWFVIAYGVLELLAGIGPGSSGVAHFAHLGGMLFGWLLLRYWKKKGRIYY